MKAKIFLSLLAAMLLAAAPLGEASECGLSCCIGAGIEGVGGATGLSLTTQYEWMRMQSIRKGGAKLSPRQAIDRNLAARPMMAMYSVPTEMIMQKITVNASYRMSEDDALVLTVPYIINDMDMLMGMKTMGGNSYSPMRMDTVQGVGDVSLLYLRDVFKDADIRTRQRLTLGVGIKAPTGRSKVRNRKGGLVHMMMQPGTGSWDALLYAGGLMAFGEHEDGGARWLLLPSATLQINGRNNLGYRVGNRFNLDLSTRYRLSSSFNLKLDVNGIHAGRDSSDGTKDPVTGLVAYQNPSISLLDDTANTGITSVFISPGFQWVLSPGLVLSGEYRLPVYQHVRGLQQVTDNWFFLRGSYRF